MDEEHRGAFRVGDARRAGMPRRRIDGAEFDRPFYGIRAPRRATIDSQLGPGARQRAEIVAAIGDFAGHMRVGAYFSHTTAALLWNLPLPLLRDSLPHVSVPGRAPRLRGIHGHQVVPELVRVVTNPTSGLPVTDPATTWAMLGGCLRNTYDLVATADAIVRTPRIPGPFGRIERAALGTIADLDAAVRMGRRAGAPLLRAVLPRVREGAASRTETWLRLTIVDAGLPEPLLDLDVYDSHSLFIGCVDLAYPTVRIAIEYEGDQHRSSSLQWQCDIEKYERLADAGWRVIRVTRDQLFRHPQTIVRRVRAALDARA